MLELTGVTLACVDTANHALALRALERSRSTLRFAQTLLLTGGIPHGVDVPAGIAVRTIAPLASRDDYSRFVLKSLLAHIDTPHVLLVQWDGYVVNALAFDPAFLACDYIGAKFRLTRGQRRHDRTRSPVMGENNRDVLTRILGLSNPDVDQLEADGVIGDAVVGGVLH